MADDATSRRHPDPEYMSCIQDETARERQRQLEAEARALLMAEPSEPGSNEATIPDLKGRSVKTGEIEQKLTSKKVAHSSNNTRHVNGGGPHQAASQDTGKDSNGPISPDTYMRLSEADDGDLYGFLVDLAGPGGDPISNLGEDVGCGDGWRERRRFQRLLHTGVESGFEQMVDVEAEPAADVFSRVDAPEDGVSPQTRLLPPSRSTVTSTRDSLEGETENKHREGSNESDHRPRYSVSVVIPSRHHGNYPRTEHLAGSEGSSLSGTANSDLAATEIGQATATSGAVKNRKSLKPKAPSLRLPLMPASGRIPSSPAAQGQSFSSDKENNASNDRHARGGRRVSGTKRTAANMNEGSINIPTASDSRTKRKRVGLSERTRENSNNTRTSQARTQTAAMAESDHEDSEAGSSDLEAPQAGEAEQDETQFYDPDQSMSDRRAVRQNIRALQKELVDSRGEYMAAESDGIKSTVQRANQNFAMVKQTSEATLDSRFLVQAGDMSARRAERAQLGGVASGINPDEFVKKAIAFMRRGPTPEQAERYYGRDSAQYLAATSQNRRGRTARNEEDDDSDAEAGTGAGNGDELNWDWFGRAVAYPNNIRPPVPAFLHGPLSVQKKARKATQRTQRQRLDPRDAVRPDELQLEEIERNDDKNLVAMCRTINRLLEDSIKAGTAACEEEVAALQDAAAAKGTEVTDAQIEAIMEKHAMREDGGLCLFRFAFNPRSFGQTVENIFYLSFLIRDGRAGIGEDKKGQTTVHATVPSTGGGQAADGSGGGARLERKQGVFHLDHPIWEKLCHAYNVKESIIPHRQEGGAGESVSGWYGS